MRGRPVVLVAVLAVAGAAVARALRRRRAAAAPPDAAPPADPRAEELRRRLEESRAIVDERDSFEEAELPVDQAEPLGDPEARRREVHDAGRAAAERMRGDRP
jgi:hypothetical protein